MRHYSCDLCGSALTPATGPRMILKMESYPAPEDTDLSDDDPAGDVVDEVARLLDEAEAAGEDAPAPAGRKTQFDLCVPCHRTVTANPLGRFRPALPRFSGN